MKYDFDHEAPRFGTYSMKYDDNGYFEAMAPGIRLDEDTIRIFLADMDFRAAPAIVAAMHRVADHANFGYTTANAAPEFNRAIMGWYQRRYGFRIENDWIIYANGALEGVSQTISAFSQPGDGIIVCYPVYSNFTSTVRRLGRRLVNCQKRHPAPGIYEMDWERFEELCAQPENKVFVLCSPENPVGRIWTVEELNRMAGICRRNGVVIVSDEIHSDFVRRGEKHTPILQAVADHSNLIMVSGPNKSFNLQGLHCAYSVIPDKALRERYMAGYEPNMPTPFAVGAMIAAYDESEEWLDQLNAYLDEGLAWAVDYLHERLPLVRAYVPQASYVLWVDFSRYGYPPDVLQYIINHRANVGVQTGLAHDPEQGTYYLRICFTCSKATMKEAIDRMAAAFAEFEAEKTVQTEK